MMLIIIFTSRIKVVNAKTKDGNTVLLLILKKWVEDVVFWCKHYGAGIIICRQ